MTWLFNVMEWGIFHGGRHDFKHFTAKTDSEENSDEDQPWSKFCATENRQGLCFFLHSFSVCVTLKAVSSHFQVILRQVFIFYTPGGVCLCTHLRSRYLFLDIYKRFWGRSSFLGLPTPIECCTQSSMTHKCKLKIPQSSTV